MAEDAFNDTFSSLPTTIFESMSRLAVEHASVNLGQGFPDNELEGPAAMKSEVSRSMLEETNQYPPLMGVPELRQAIAAHSLRYCGLEVDWRTQVLVTVGATEALAAAFLGLLNPGDEAVVFAPLYDSYVPMIRRAGAVPVTVTLRPPEWTFDPIELKAAFTPRTKLVVVNTPHNPTGKVWTEDELHFVAQLTVARNAYAVLDEVYEHLVFPGSKHVTMRNMPGMTERAIRIGSAGKTFSFTDFKIGWVTGPTPMVSAVTKAHQFLVFTVNSALQRAVAKGLDQHTEFYLGLGPALAQKRKFLEERISRIGFRVLPAQGTYFLVADYSPLLPLMQNDAQDEGDTEFCYRITREAGVTLIPVSAFYEDAMTAPRTLVRFVFCKTEGKLKSACERLEAYFSSKRPIS